MSVFVQVFACVQSMKEAGGFATCGGEVPPVPTADPREPARCRGVRLWHRRGTVEGTREATLLSRGAPLDVRRFQMLIYGHAL